MHERASRAGVGPTVVIGGGGTGGHLYPALALAEALRRQRPDLRIVLLGSTAGLEARVLPERSFEYRLHPVRGVMGRGVLERIGAVLRLVWSLLRVAVLFQRIRPAVVVVTGGFAGAPAGIAARTFGIPLVLQEQNIVPGMTTRLLSRSARQIHLAFPGARERLDVGAQTRVLDSGNPIRTPESADPAEARRTFRIPESAPVVLIVGGSQGSKALNEAALAFVGRLTEEGRALPSGAVLIWATGPSHYDRIHEAVAERGIPNWLRLFGYLDAMPLALSVTSVALSRAGAMTTSEFLAWGIPAILVPLPTAAADHQRHNAESLAASGAAAVLPESELSAEALDAALSDLLGDPSRVEAMRDAARSIARPRATESIVGEILGLLPATSKGAA